MGSEKPISLVFLVAVISLTILLGEASAQYPNIVRRTQYAICYDTCYARCISDTRKKVAGVPDKFLDCAWFCLKKCTLSGGPSTDASYYCKLACALDGCVDSVDDGVKMDGCMNKCSSGSCK